VAHQLGVPRCLAAPPRCSPSRVYRTCTSGRSTFAEATVHRRRAQPYGRRLKGVAVGTPPDQASIRFVPSIPYLLADAAVPRLRAGRGQFAATGVLGFLVVPGDSPTGGFMLVFQWHRTRLVVLGGNQSAARHPSQVAGSIHGATAA